MKRLFKSLLALMMIMLMSFTAFAEEETTTQQIPTDKEQLAMYANYFVTSFANYSDDELEFMINNSTGDVQTSYSSFKSMTDEKGAVKDIGEITVENTEDGGYKVTLPIVCENGNGELNIIYKATSVGLISSAIPLYEAQKSVNIVSAEFSAVNKAEKANAGMAALNTVMGMTTVILVLVLILLIISLFKYFDAVVAKVSGLIKKIGKHKKTVNNAIEQAVANIEKKEAEGLDDLELVAVITAAISAQTGAGTDSFIVRKIKRR